MENPEISVKSVLSQKNEILFNYLRSLDTEQRNEAAADIDVANSFEIVRLINEEDKGVAGAVELRLKETAAVVDIVAAALSKGGRLIYAGSGTSGRIGVVDAAECPPTFGTNPETVQGLIAGGKEAMFRAQEGAEDIPENGRNDVDSIELTPRDVLCGLAASGRTPYVLGALERATEIGAKTIFICCVPVSQLKLPVQPDFIIDVPVGPEIIMGSTRMKSATAQKMICNMITTGAMIRLGKVYENVMVDLQLTNKKLEERACRILMMFTGIDYKKAGKLLEDSGRHVKTALVMALTGLSVEESRRLLKKNQGIIKKALSEFEKK